MKIGLYTNTYRGIWYRGGALDLFQIAKLAKSQGWEGLELDAQRPHAAPMDWKADDRKRLRDLAGELDLPLIALSPTTDFASPVSFRQEATMCHIQECIKLARDLGIPICKIFVAWRGITMKDGVGSYELTYSCDPYPFWKAERRSFALAGIREAAKFAGDHGVVLAIQNHGPDIVNNYRDTLELIEEIGSPHVKACMDINIEDEPESEDRAKEIVRASGKLMVHSHVNGEFVRDAQGKSVMVGAGYFDNKFWGRKVVYPTYFDALAASGYRGYIDWEYCHPAIENGKIVGIEYVHNQTRLAFEYMKELRDNAVAKAAKSGSAKK